MAIHPPIQDKPGLSRFVHDVQLQQENSRMPAAREVMEEFERLAIRANDLERYVNERLAPVMRPEVPGECVEQKVTQYPPLFNALDMSGREIEAALDSIERAIGRTEL